MKTWAWGLAALAAVIGGAVAWDKTHPSSGSGSGGGGGLGAGPEPSQLDSLARWHVAAVESGYGATVVPPQSAAGRPTDFQIGDYVLFPLAYQAASVPTEKTDPVMLAIGQVDGTGSPTASGKKTGYAKYLKPGNWNSNYNASVLLPPAGVDFAITIDDVAQVLTKDQAKAAGLA